MTSLDSFENVELSPYKWATHLPKLKKLAENEDISPITVELDLVDYCNHNCGWCVDPKHLHNSLDSPFVAKLLEELKSIGVEGIVFKGGGEPTLNPAFEQAIERAKMLGFEAGIVTNGSRLHALSAAIVRNADYVRISIDGPTSETHKRIHNSDDFEKILAGIKELVRLREELQQRHPIIGLSFAMDHSMIEAVPKTIRLGDELNVDYILLRPPFFEEVGRENSMTIKQKKELLSAFEKESKAYPGKMKIFIDHWISDSEANEFSSRGDSPRRGKYLEQGANGIEHVTGRCLASPLMAIITADKKVYPCCNLRFIEEWNIGTIDYEKGQTLERLWRSTRRKEIMKKIHRTECIHVCTHPLSRYNEIIEYLKSPQHHRGFV
ncbi:MAG: radical SAM protein [Nanoarchaeota archaeon]|nr:radical SAM protein [Nanoarchaeota archaeon]